MSTLTPSTQLAGERSRLWRRWVGANAISEAAGLGLTLALTGAIIARLGAFDGVAAAVIAFTGAVASGVIEATIVGLSQHWAMEPWFPSITRRHWWLATLAGALIAYMLGYLPSTIIDLTQAGDAAAAVSEPPQAIVLLLAAALGAVAGAILSFAQYRVLRESVSGAGWWVPANMLAWAVGMPIVFATIDLAFVQPALWQSILVVVGGLLLMGAAVGAIHGAVLVQLAERVHPQVRPSDRSRDLSEAGA